MAANTTRVPEPGSLRCLLVTSAARRLYVPPLRWTTENLIAIDWPTAKQIPISGSAEDNAAAMQHFSGNSPFIYAYQTLRFQAGNSCRDESIRRLFCLFLRKHSLKMDTSKFALQFDGKSRADVPCPLVARSPLSRRSVYAFVDKAWLDEKRYEDFKTRRQPLSVARKTVKEINALEFDPYFAGVLIAMAQEARLLTKDEEIQVHLFTPSKDRESVVQFSAKFPIAYLKKFDDPYKAVTCPVVLTKKTLSLDRPMLIQKILKEILRICEASQPVDSTKRKAMVKSPDDTESSELMESRAKRRRTEENDEMERPG